jgi:hypothetical protein
MLSSEPCSKIRTGSGSSSAGHSIPRASSTVAGASDGDAGDVRVPALEAVGVLRRELAAAAGGHADDDGHVELAARHVQQVAALFTIWSSASRLKLTVMTSTIGRMPPAPRRCPAPTNADSDSGVSRIRSGRTPRAGHG